MAQKVSAAMAEQIAAIHGHHFKITWQVEFKRNGITTTTRGRSPEIHGLKKIMDEDGNDQSHTYSRDWLVEDVYHTTCWWPKADVILLKMDSGDA